MSKNAPAEKTMIATTPFANTAQSKTTITIDEEKPKIAKLPPRVRAHKNLITLDSLELKYDGWESDKKEAEETHFNSPSTFNNKIKKTSRKTNGWILRGLRDTMKSPEFRCTLEKLGESCRGPYVQKLYNPSAKTNLPKYLNAAQVKAKPCRMLTDHVIQTVSNHIMAHLWQNRLKDPKYEPTPEELGEGLTSSDLDGDDESNAHQEDTNNDTLEQIQEQDNEAFEEAQEEDAPDQHTEEDE